MLFRSHFRYCSSCVSPLLTETQGELANDHVVDRSTQITRRFRYHYQPRSSVQMPTSPAPTRGLVIVPQSCRFMPRALSEIIDIDITTKSLFLQVIDSPIYMINRATLRRAQREFCRKSGDQHHNEGFSGDNYYSQSNAEYLVSRKGTRGLTLTELMSSIQTARQLRTPAQLGWRPPTNATNERNHLW